MKKLYVISGVTGMTGSELSKMLVSEGHRVIGFDNFFASSIKTVEKIMDNPLFSFFEYDINNSEQMQEIKQMVQNKKGKKKDKM